MYNCLFAPLVLLFWACRIYLSACFAVVFNRCFYKFCCCLCRSVGCCWVYTDTSFPPCTSSLGDLSGDSAHGDEGGRHGVNNIVWLRPSDFSQNNPGCNGKMQLYEDTINSGDICQGALGDCWLLAAMACLAEHRGAINVVFRSRERNPRGKYRLRLYDGVNERWENIVVDDSIPCNRQRWEEEGIAKPVFSQPNGNELWVVLLEKAFAKFCGSYAATEGGFTIWAIRAMTGDPARWFENSGANGWRRQDLVNKEDPKNRKSCLFFETGEELDDLTMFAIMQKYHKMGSILCASGSSGSGGLHKGHAYSITQVRKVTAGGFAGVGGKVFRLVQLRNPWGCGEWSGDWSDKSDMWAKHPTVKNELKYTDLDDGSFWMSWEDYVRNWQRVGVVHRTVNIHSLRLHLKDDSFCAPLQGCAAGCCRFWCCCEGARRLYCPTRSSEATVAVNRFSCLIL